MNSNYENTLDKNFEKALTLCSKSYSHEDLIEFLRNGNIPEKQYSALSLDELKSQDDAKIFLSNLINCDGKIREAVAQKFLEFSKNEKYCEYFSEYPEILAQSTIDINANITRMVIEGLAKMSGYQNFAKHYVNKLLIYIKDAFEGLDKIIYKDKKYTINKQLFKLYWCLEGLNNYYDYVDKQTLKDILAKALNQEYTVREKAAQIIKKLPQKEYKNLYELAMSDENYYVKQIMKD